jgi:hypothetical protein
MVRRVRTKEVLGMGFEPTWNQDFSKTRLMDALNFYNYCYDQKKAKDFLVDYCKHMKLTDDAKKFKSLPESKVPLQVGWIARMLVMGMSPDDHTQSFFDDNYTKLLSEKARKQKVKVKVSTAPKISVQERILEKARDEAGEIEGMIDDFISSGFKKKYDFEKYFKAKNLSNVVLQRICEMFVDSSQEISEVLSGGDDQLKEAYSHFKKPQLRKLSQFYDTIVAASNKIAIENKPVRRKRRVKEKPISQIVSKVKYLDKYDELQLKGMPIEKVVGASQIWTYNIKTKLLSVYNTDNAKGLTFKGTTIQNYDKKTSIGKRLRKPDVIIPELLDAGKIKIKKILPELTTKEQTLTGRFNCDTIVLKISK